MEDATFTAFSGTRLIATGSLRVVALAVKAAMEREIDLEVLIFDDRSGRPIDLDLRGSRDEVAARFRPAEEGPPRGVGRPKLGVVAKEVTLLPRHWEWLAAQPGGASVTLRKLVDAARKATDLQAMARLSQEAADRFMSVMLGNHAGYEEASRALYSGDRERFIALSEPWPADLRDHARRLAGPAWAEPAP